MIRPPIMRAGVSLDFHFTPWQTRFNEPTCNKPDYLLALRSGLQLREGVAHEKAARFLPWRILLKGSKKLRHNVLDRNQQKHPLGLPFVKLYE
jgi:hypothetical protein